MRVASIVQLAFQNRSVSPEHSYCSGSTLPAMARWSIVRPFTLVVVVPSARAFQ
jgi:hypothetical protein